MPNEPNENIGKVYVDEVDKSQKRLRYIRDMLKDYFYA